MTMADLQFDHHGTVVLCHAITEAGQQWLDANISEAMTVGLAVVIEPRYLPAIVQGAMADGLVTQPAFGHFNETFDSRTWKEAK